MRKWLFIIVASAFPTSAWAEDLCRAQAMRDVGALQDSSSVLPRGAFQDAVTQYNREIATGRTSFCSHGGYCYPTHVNVGGERVEAMRLVNCAIGAESWRDEETISYSVDVDRSRNSAAALRFDDVENQLVEFGACAACADNAARHYVERPQGQCGILVRQALEGNPVARRRFENMPDFCTWDYRARPAR